MNATRVLMEHSIDYAGLFPPAALSMAEAVAQYAAYHDSTQAWLLGRFVLPVEQISAFEQSAAPLLPQGAIVRPWQLSAILSDNVARDVAAIEAFNTRFNADGALSAEIVAVELRVSNAAEIEPLFVQLPVLESYWEVPRTSDLDAIIAEVAGVGGFAKMRTGGITPDAIPEPDSVLRFLHACTDAGVPFKATAGLHHAITGSYALTYQPDSPRATLYGYLNMLLAAALVRADAPDADVLAALSEPDSAAIGLDETLHWRSYALDAMTLRRLRYSAMLSWGSCSFVEPVAELEALQV